MADDDTIEHGQWKCVLFDEEDGDGWDTPGWYAQHKETGERRIIHHSRFRFQMTPERFAWLAEHNFPVSPGRGPWTNECIDLAIGQERNAA